MKLAIIQDELVRKGGAEQVVLSFQAAFPDAPIFTLSYNRETTYPEFKNSKISTPWFGKLIKDDVNLKRFFYPFGIWAMRSLDLSSYDVILMSTTHCAKYVNVNRSALVITYCHTPFRLVYRPNSYAEVANSNFIKSFLYKFVINRLKNIDQASAKRTDFFITNAIGVIPRIEEAYHPINKVTVINPPVKVKKFYLSKTIEDYFLVVSRFEPYKKIDLVIEAFNQMPDKKLIIVGKGSLKAELKKSAKDNITFLEDVDSIRLGELYSKCKALIFPQLEDYGITPLEANASGRPVIAFGEGGVRDTMIPYATGGSDTSTAIFFKPQSSIGLLQAVKLFENLKFNPQFIRKHAEKFDEDVFVVNVRDFVETKYKLHINGQ